MPQQPNDRTWLAALDAAITTRDDALRGGDAAAASAAALRAGYVVIARHAEHPLTLEDVRELVDGDTPPSASDLAEVIGFVPLGAGVLLAHADTSVGDEDSSDPGVWSLHREAGGRLLSYGDTPDAVRAALAAEGISA